MKVVILPHNLKFAGTVSSFNGFIDVVGDTQMSMNLLDHCNAVSFYKMADTYPVCVLLRCDPFSSCVWMPSVNFTAARVQSHFALQGGVVQSDDTTSQIATMNQSAMTSPQGPVVQSTPSGNPVTQDWNVNNGNVPPWTAGPTPAEAAGPDSAVQGTLLRWRSHGF